MAQQRGRRQGGADDGPPASRRRSARSGWRATVDSWGGFTVIGVIAAAVIGLGVLVWVSLPSSISEDSLMGEAVTIGPGTHVNSLDQMGIVAGRPPVGGPHLPRWQPIGIYDEPVSDGLAVHALEHGVIWISYNPSLLADGDLDALKSVAGDFSRDVILSPRPGNATAIAVASWGRLLTLDNADRDQLQRFVETNRNRSPEPNVR